MNDRARFKAAYAALMKARKTHDAWMKAARARVNAGRKILNKARGYRSAKNVHDKMQAFMQASKPFIYPK